MAYEIIAGRTPSQKAKFGLAGTIFIGKQYVQMERTMSLATSLHLDVSSPHIILVAGKRGSGKSYTLGVIIEGLLDLPTEIAENLSTLVFDTLGIFWTMKYPNYRDDKMITEWKLNPKAFSVKIFVPIGLYDKYQERGVPVDQPFALRPIDIGAGEWADIFEVSLLSPEGTLIERIVEKALDKFENFEIADLIKLISKDKDSSTHEKNAISNRFKAVNKWGLFSKEGTQINDLFRGGSAVILDLSAYSEMDNGQNIKALVIGLISKKILEQRLTARKAEEIKLISEGGFIAEETTAVADKKAPLVWMVIDEAHEFLPREGKTLSSNALVQLLREGRQPGISMILATQQPGKIHTDVMTQADIILSHRLTAKIDIDALNQIASTYVAKDIQYYIDSLPAEKGTAILLDDKLEKIYSIKIRPRLSWHGGEDPTALRGQLSTFGS